MIYFKRNALSRISETEEICARVVDLMLESLVKSPLDGMARDYMEDIGTGKMLRARMAFAVGGALEADFTRVLHAAAAVEMVHAATLLHDDVIDGGSLRRGSPTFWKQHGVQGAILVGDMLLFKAIELVRGVGDHDLTGELIDLTGEVCMAEVEQELVLRGSESHSWEDCVSLARRKTGSLFAFSAMAPATEPQLAHALKQAGYLVGTAYQLCDDILDASDKVEQAGKSLGSDMRRKKTTAATAAPEGSSVAPEHIANLCAKSTDSLAKWPAVQDRWKSFMRATINPVLESLMAGIDHVG